MPEMPSINDYKTGGPGEIDWARYNAANEAYYQAQVDRGEKCRRCREYMPFSVFGGPNGNSPGYQRACPSCTALACDKAEVSSDRYARCPKCRHSWDPFNNGFAPNEGENELSCPECEHDFTLDVGVTYTFRSPALIPEPEPEPEPEEEEEDETEEGDEE